MKLSLRQHFLRSLNEESLVFITSAQPVELDISNNQLSHLPPDIFKYAKYRHLSLANNSLTSLPSDVLSNQPDLEYLDLSGNLLDSPELKPALFTGTPSLSQLYLNDNRYVRAALPGWWSILNVFISMWVKSFARHNTKHEHNSRQIKW